MSILDIKTPHKKSRAELLAENLTSQPAIRFKQFLDAWKEDIRELWKAPNPQEVLDFIGNEASDLFNVSAKTAAYLEALRPGCTTDAMAMVGEFQTNKDGTVTILSIPAQGVILPIKPTQE